MRGIGYYNGEIGFADEMKISMLDRCAYFGDGVYDFMLGSNGKLYEADRHLDRFYNSLKGIRIDFTMSREELLGEIDKCIKALGHDGMFKVYWQASRGTAARNHDFPEPAVKPDLMIMVDALKTIPLDKKISLITVDDIRFTMCNIKTLNLLPNVLVAQRGHEAGCKEVIQHRNGRVTECAHSNCLIVKNGKVRTAPLDNLILPGITRMNIKDTCLANGIPFVEEPFTVDDVFAADEVLVSSTSKFCVAVDKVDGKPVGGKAPEIVKLIQDSMLQKFMAETGKMPDFKA